MQSKVQGQRSRLVCALQVGFDGAVRPPSIFSFTLRRGRLLLRSGLQVGHDEFKPDIIQQAYVSVSVTAALTRADAAGVRAGANTLYPWQKTCQRGVNPRAVQADRSHQYELWLAGAAAGGGTITRGAASYC
jgi:hypothetical protein